jgi:hypothetical protein
VRSNSFHRQKVHRLAGLSCEREFCATFIFPLIEFECIRLVKPFRRQCTCAEPSDGFYDFFNFHRRSCSGFLFPEKSSPCAALCWDGCPPMKCPVCLPLGCALLAVRACLLVLLCRAHPTNNLTRYLLYPAYPTAVPSVRHTISKLSCL